MFSHKSRHLFAYSAVILGLSLGLVGCGDDDNGHHHHHSGTTSSIDLGVLSSSEEARVIVGYYPGEKDASDADVVITNKAELDKSKLPKLGAKQLAAEREIIHRCGLMDLNPMEEILAKKGDVLGKVNSTYTDLAKGETTSVYVATSYKNVEVQKLHDNGDTKSVIVLAEVVNGKPVANESVVAGIDNYFGVSNPYDPDGLSIGKRVRSTFGNEWGITNGDGGMDGTTKIIIVLLSEKTIGTGYYGYFNPVDCLSKSESEKSNAGEILYLNAEKDNPMDRYSTVAHEFQHMCDFNQKYIRDGQFTGSQNEMTTINEGQSVLAEDMTGFRMDASCDGSKVPGNSFIYSVAQAFLDNPGALSFTTWDSSSVAYGQGYMALRYIADNYGTDKVKQIATSPNTGVDNIVSNLGTDFSSLMCRMMQGCTGVSSMPTLMKFKSLLFNHDYYIASGSTGTNRTLGSLASDEIGKASDFTGGVVTLETNTAVVYTLQGDGSRVVLNYELPEYCSGYVVVSNNGVFDSQYEM